MMNKTGIYIHIPFCGKKCGYCDFNSFSADNFECKEKVFSEYINALKNEILSDSLIGNSEINTIFIGGGTPSILPSCFIGEIMKALGRFKISHDAEITIESNPNSLSLEKLEAYRKFGINRLSIGLQAWQNHLLKTLGRIHRIDDFLLSFENARKAGFENINVDLIFALPGQTAEDWAETLKNVCALSPEHISCYSLIIEENTPFHKLYSGVEVCSDDLDRKMYYGAKDILSANGYAQYEISNFSKPDKFSRHNVLYWERGNYLGFGLGAHSLWNGRRFENSAHLKNYVEKNGLVRENISELNIQDEMEEFMFLGLRLTKGVSVNGFKEVFGTDIFSVYGEIIEKNISSGLLIFQEERLYLSEKGVDISNRVMADFLK